MNKLSLRSAILWALAVGPIGSARSADGPDYNRVIRPILSENCFFCHGQDAHHRKADLRLDTAEGQRTGKVIVPGKPDESELIRRIVSHDATEVMPPPKSNRKITDAQRKLLKEWIASGAKYQGHWAFEKPARPPVPKITGATNPIDAFILHRLAERGIKPAGTADKTTLIRRLTYDMIGLPPTPQEVDDFLADTSADAFAKRVDRLQQNRHYGERMALPWLDAARYADSNGFQQDGDTFQWVWRDWVVRAINTNMPFDQFTIEQLAGDLLPNPTLDQKIATGFNRNHLVNGEGGAIPEEQRFNILFDRVDTTATNWLGLTMACAQCHDHKYDPITMKDYYGILAGFNNVSESGVAGRQSSAKRVSPPFIEAPSAEQSAQLAERQKKAADLKKAFDERLKEWITKTAMDPKFPDKAIHDLAKNTDPKTKADRDAKLRKYYEEKVDAKGLAAVKAADKAVADYRAEEIPKVMVMADDAPRESHILDRGEYLKKKEKVTFNTPAFLPPLPKEAPRNRLGLARWLVSSDNPLTARVAVNRLWQTIFGTGLVKTGEDFGVQSELPDHPELLDWLAVEFRESGWNMKAMVRLMVTSDLYRRSSKVDRASLASDPENRLYARFPRVRLPAMMLRDTALSVSGLIDLRIGGKPVYPYQPEGIWDSLAITKERDFTYPMSDGKDLYRRSIYTFWRRTVGPANMFDASARQTCRVRPNVTNTPLHALTTLNDSTWTEAARVTAEGLVKSPGTDAERITLIFRRILARPPVPAESAILERILREQRESFRKDPAAATKLVSVGRAPRDTKIDSADHAAWTTLCSALFNLDEALTRE